MSRRIRIAWLTLALFAAVTTAFGAADVAGVKATEPPDADALAAPAGTPLGAAILTFILLTASSAVMLGGELWQRIVPSRVQQSAGEDLSEARADRAQRSPKNKSTHVFSRRHAPQDRRARRNRGVTLRKAEQMKPRRRGGGGCRGVR